MRHAKPSLAALLIAVGCEVTVGQTFIRSTYVSLAETPPLSPAFGVVAADLNGDGKPDLAVTCSGNGFQPCNSSIQVFLADDQRILRWNGRYAAGSQPLSIVAADFTGDGRIDLAAADISGSAIVILDGVGDGTFREARSIKVDAGPAYLAVGDLNRDGRPDLVVSHQTGTVSVLLGEAGGTFRAAQVIPNTRPITGEQLVLADLNGDRVLDLAVGHRGNSAISVFFGNGNGTFGAESEVPTGRSPQRLCAGDFNQDGIPDLATDGGESGIYILFGDGKGGFNSAPVIRQSGRVTFLVPGDWNGAGKLEVAISDFDANLVTLWQSGGAVGLQSPRSYPTSETPIAAAAADFNGDGISDLAVVNRDSGNVNLFLGSRDGALAVAYTLGPLDPVGLVAGTVSRNGGAGLAVVSRGTESLQILYPGDEGRLMVSDKLPLGRLPSSIVRADVTGDGIPDLAVGHTGSPEIRIFPGRSGGGFGSPIVLPSSTTMALAAGDLNGDGVPDLVLVGTNLDGTKSLSVAISRGGGRFEPWRTVLLGGQSMLSVAVFDWDNDGVADILFGTYPGGFTPSSGGLYLVRGDGSGGFEPPENLAGGWIDALVTADFNLDGKPDLIAFDNEEGRILVALSRDSGPSLLTVMQSPFDRLRQPAVADLNGDGYPDLAVLHTAGVSIYSGSAAGTLQLPPRSYLIFGEYLAAADLNQDGIPDLALAGGPRDSIGVAWNDPASDAAPSAPVPRVPADNAEIPQNVALTGCAPDPYRGNGYAIRFRWDPPAPGELLAGYELQVFRQNLDTSLLDRFLAPPSPNFAFTRCLGLVADDELDNWQWRVRAHFAGGSAPGPWSETAVFNFAPCRLADGRACGPPPGAVSEILESQLADRSGHSASLLAGGEVMIAGSPTIAGGPTEIYVPASRRFKGGPAMSVGRSSHTATVLRSGKVLLTGGSERRASAEVYDPSTDAFEPAIEMPERLGNHTATLLPDGRVLIAGGRMLRTPSYDPSSAIFDPATGQFIPTGKLNFARSSHSATLLSTGEVLIVGGNAETFPAEIYSPATGEFRPIGRTLAPLSSHTATLLKSGQVLLIGTPGAELYDPVANRFESLPAMNRPRFSHTATLLADGSVLIAGGRSGNPYLADVERFDPVSRRFEVLPPLSVARGFHTATLLPNGSVLIIGGQFGSAIRSVELYTPPSR